MSLNDAGQPKMGVPKICIMSWGTQTDRVALFASPWQIPIARAYPPHIGTDQEPWKNNRLIYTLVSLRNIIMNTAIYRTKWAMASWLQYHCQQEKPPLGSMYVHRLFGEWIKIEGPGDRRFHEFLVLPSCKLTVRCGE